MQPGNDDALLEQALAVEVDHLLLQAAQHDRVAALAGGALAGDGRVVDVVVEQFEEHEEVGPVALVGRGRGQHQVAGVAPDQAQGVRQRLPVVIGGQVVGLVDDDQIPGHVGQRGPHVGAGGRRGSR